MLKNGYALECVPYHLREIAQLALKDLVLDEQIGRHDNPIPWADANNVTGASQISDQWRLSFEKGSGAPR
jgi:hypothetical protein